MVRSHHLNADFDLALRENAPSASRFARQVAELSLHGILAAEAGDSVVVDVPVPVDFRDALEAAGLPCPDLVRGADARPDHEYAPWGWSPAAVAANQRHRVPSPHPDLEVVRRVNGRRFSLELEQRLGFGGAGLGWASDLKQVEALVAVAEPSSHGWVVKAEHSNAALGNKRLRHRQLQDADRRWLERILTAGPVVVEQWLSRTADLCAVFEVRAGAGLSGPVSIHEVTTTADGAFVGAWYGSGGPCAQWRDAMVGASRAVASALAHEGYFGPVCLDALVWEGEDGPRLRPLVEINARRHMSEGWRRLWTLSEGVTLGRFFAAASLRLPESHEGFAEALGADRWRPRDRRGILLTSPLWLTLQGRPRPPLKLGVAFCGDSRSEVEAMESRFRAVFVGRS